jgi:hypothetical protein
LGGPEELAVDLGQLLGHGHPAMEQVDARDAQPDQLAPAQATIGGHQDQRPITGADGVGQGGDPGHGGKAHLWRPLLAGALDGAGVAEQITGLHGRAQDARQQPVGLGDGARAQLLGLEVGQPGTDGQRIDAAQGGLAEGREQEPAQQIGVQVAGGRPQVRRRGLPALGPFGQVIRPSFGSVQVPRCRSASTMAR